MSISFVIAFLLGLLTGAPFHASQSNVPFAAGISGGGISGDSSNGNTVLNGGGPAGRPGTITGDSSNGNTVLNGGGPAGRPGTITGDSSNGNTVLNGGGPADLPGTNT